MRSLMIAQGIWLTHSVLACGACMPIAEDRILGRDLLLAEPALKGVPSSFVVGFAPPPGGRRVIAAAEIARIARMNNVTVTDPPEVCFEIPVLPLERDAAEAAMRRVLPDSVRLEVLEIQETSVPAGELVFPFTALEPPDVNRGGSQIWRGFVQYTSTKRTSVWVRVRASQTRVAVVARRDLPANLPVDVSGVQVTTWLGPVRRDHVAERLEDVAGRVLRRPIRAGELIPLGLLEEQPTVHRGESVPVEVLCGTARLQFSAVAERDGRSGDFIDLRNPSTGRTFRARLDGARAVLTLRAGSEL